MYYNYDELFIYIQIDLPESVTKRYNHSLSTFYISKQCVWVIVTGGKRERNKSRNTGKVIVGSDVTFIIELGIR